jgi:hypothetical protein
VPPDLRLQANGVVEAPHFRNQLTTSGAGRERRVVHQRSNPLHDLGNGEQALHACQVDPEVIRRSRSTSSREYSRMLPTVRDGRIRPRRSYLRSVWGCMSSISAAMLMKINSGSSLMRVRSTLVDEQYAHHMM